MYFMKNKNKIENVLKKQNYFLKINIPCTQLIPHVLTKLILKDKFDYVIHYG